MLNWQKIFAGGLTKPDENGGQHRQSYAQVLRPIQEMHRKLLASSDAKLRYKTKVYMTLVSVTVAGVVLGFTPVGWTAQALAASALHLNSADVIKLRLPSIANLVGPSEDGFRERVNQGTEAAAQLAVLYGAGIAGEYRDDLVKLTGKYSVNQVAEVALAIDQARSTSRPGIEPGSVCRAQDLACLKIEPRLLQGDDPKTLVANGEDVSRVLEVLAKGRTAAVSKDTCSRVAAKGFYGYTPLFRYNPLVYVTALSRKDAAAALNAVKDSWVKGSFDAGKSKVGSLRELLTHRLPGSCDPLPIAVYELDGKTTSYLVSALISEGTQVGAALFMLYDLDAAGVTDRGMLRIQTANLQNQENLTNQPGRPEEVGAPQVVQTYAEILKQMKRENLSIDISTVNSNDVALLSSLIQPSK